MAKKEKLPDYSEFRDKPAEVGHNMLAMLSNLAVELTKEEAEVARLNELLKKANERVLNISQVKIPELMDAAEIEEFTTREGIKISIKVAIRASIPKGGEQKAFRWLEKHEHGNLIKRQFIVEFGKGEEEWAESFQKELSEREKALKFEVKRGVNAQTLAAFAREQLEEGVDFPLETFGVFRQRFAKVDTKKADKAKF